MKTDSLSRKRVFAHPTEPAPTSAFSCIKTEKSNVNKSDDPLRVYSVSPENPLPDQESISSDPNGETEDSWTLDLHRDFVEAVLEIGLAHASPAVIKEHLVSENSEVNAERLKSHLQKYRKNRAKSKTEFLREYDEWIKKAMILGKYGLSEGLRKPQEVMGDMNTSRTKDTDLLGGHSAAFLTYSIMAQDSDKTLREQDESPLDVSTGATASAPPPSKKLRPSSPYNTKSFEKSAHDFANHFVGTTEFDFPKLTKEEEASPLGIAIAHTRGLVLSMSQQIMSERVELSLQVSGQDGTSSGTSSFGSQKISEFDRDGATSLAKNHSAGFSLNSDEARKKNRLAKSFPPSFTTPTLVSTPPVELSTQSLLLDQTAPSDQKGFYSDRRQAASIDCGGHKKSTPKQTPEAAGDAFWGHSIQLVDGGMLSEGGIHSIEDELGVDSSATNAPVVAIRERIHSFASLGALDVAPQVEHFNHNMSC